MAGSIEKQWGSVGIGAILLAPLGGVYALAWWAYQSIYTLKLKEPFQPHRPVIVVGNLIAGGAGKTPVTIFLAKLLLEMGEKVVIGCSGYGFPHEHGAALAPGGELLASEWADEPAMIRYLLPSVPLVVGRDRVLAAELVHAHLPDHILLMDDGFQHLRLRNHISIVLDEVLLNSFCIPAGPYREPKTTGRARADVVLPCSQFQIEVLSSTLEIVNGPPCETKVCDLLCAIARPERLVNSLVGRGIQLQTIQTLPDHATLLEGNLLSKFESDRPLIVTAKDWVKMKERTDLADKTIFAANYEVHISPASELTKWLRAKLDGIN